MTKAPTITSLRIVQLGANFAHLKWDNVGSNFFYNVEYAIDNGDGVYSWNSRDVVSDPEWFEDRILAPDTKYIFRIATTFPGMDQSDWVKTEVFETFSENAYTTTSVSQLIPNRVFVDQKLRKNKSYINFGKDPIYATLMSDTFVYDAGIANITNVENYVVSDPEFHEIQGPIEQVCVNKDRTYLGYKGDVLYLFERYQNMAKVSNDGGQNWWYYQALTGRCGYPIARTAMSQNRNTSFILGYDDLYYGRASDEIRFSSNQHFWSDDQITFVRLDVDASIPFNTLVFGKYTAYPENIKRKVEAQSANDTWVYAVAEDKFRRILTKNAPIGDDGSGNSVRLWDATTYRITNNEKTVVKKLEVYNDVCYALVTGAVADMKLDRRVVDNVKPCPEVGVYRFDEVYVPEVFTLGNFTLTNATTNYVKGVDITNMTATFVNGGTHAGQVTGTWENRVFRGKNGVLMTVKSSLGSKNRDAFKFEADLYDATGKLDATKVAAFNAAFQYPAKFELIIDGGVPVKPVIPNGGSWVRVFGNTQLERDSIEHKYSNMSTNGRQLFVGSATYKFDSTIDDPDTVARYDDVDFAVKYQSEYPYLSDKRFHFYLWSTEDGKKFSRRPQQYYNEANFNWMGTTGQRCWISHSNQAVVINAEQRHTYRIDPEFLINKEVWDKGNVKLYLDNVKFEGFSQYCNGIMFHKAYDREFNSGGEIIAYYEYPYRVRNEATVVWRPEHVMLEANLQKQEREIPFEPVVQTGLVDPDLRPLLLKMGPEAYYDDGLFTKFGEYYLQFISEGTESYYNRMVNLIRNKYPREKDSFEYLWSEIRRRNIYLDQEKRDSVIRFFESKATNFYSSKGTADSYKFLFKLLYNADVEIEVESAVGIDYDIVVSSTNIDQSLVGRTIYTPTGRSNVTYIERIYDKGLLRWKLTIHNLIGKYEEGQTLLCENSAFTGSITRGVTGKELAYSDIDYINRNRSYYVMKIKSELNTARYRDDVVRFVHPVGFGFIGVTLLTVFINGGISMFPQQTIVEMNKAYRWDAGLPETTPLKKTAVDPNSPAANPDPLFDPLTGELVETDLTPTPFDIAKWEKAIDTSTGKPFETRKYDTDEDPITWNGIKYLPSQRRLKWSPLFSDFSSRLSDLRRLVDKRMKDDMHAPRDVSGKLNPTAPSQKRIGE